jgi:hypothetical protein
MKEERFEGWLKERMRDGLVVSEDSVYSVKIER